MDEPTHCWQCPCYYETEGMHTDECQLANRKHPNADDEKGHRPVPDWCPLEEVSENFVVANRKTNLLGKSIRYVVFDE